MRYTIVRNRSALAGLVITAAVIVLAAFAPIVCPHDYKEQNLARNLLPPFWYEDGDASYPLGTDHLGRCVLSRIIYGARTSLVVGVGAVLFGGTIGTFLGLVSGFFCGAIDAVIMRLADTQLSFSPILLCIAIMAMTGRRGSLSIAMTLGLVSWVQYARIVRGSVLSVKQREFVLAARVIGGTDPHIIRRHILPNVLSPIIAIAGVNVSSMILGESALSFLGVGIQPPTPAWGYMLSEGREVFAIAWWNAVFPGLAIVITVIGINFLADGLQERV
jgi:peptide/nickel transport system permease protein